MPETATLADQFHALDAAQRRRVHLSLCHAALEVWELYALTNGPLEYIESVVGTRQRVDSRLPAAALAAAQAGREAPHVSAGYLEPLSALQDDDLVLPENVLFAYYAIYNLYQKYARSAAIADWTIVNQALAAQAGGQNQIDLLEAAIRLAKN